MKKFIYTLGALTVSTVLLMGCSSDKKEPKDNSQKVTNEVKKEEPAKEAYNNEEEKIKKAWNEYHAPRMLAFSKTMKEFSKQFIDAGENSSLIQQKQWQDTVGTLIGEMSYEVKELKSYNGQIPKGYEEINANLIASMNEYQYVAENMPAAIALLVVGEDTSLLDKCTEKIIKGTEKMNKANELFDQVNK